ncbi:hypothetical protein ACFY1L_47150 [Streptomyces sp. NPDC001663]|uniref:hypothetical protein n=1 Tax=Streptomyces sp. NPDC001663 TaxID=3364597 RepID=UPI0036D1C4DF
MGQQEEPDAESGDDEARAEGLLHHANTTPGTHPIPQTRLVLALEGGVLLGVAHHPRQLPLEVIHQLPFTPPAR